MPIKFAPLIFSLKLLIFRLAITYFGTPRLQQITPFLSRNYRGACLQPPPPPPPPLATVCVHNVTGPPTHQLFYFILGNKPLF